MLTTRASFVRRMPRRPRRVGFTLLELQVAIILLAFAVVTLASLLATQSRLLKRLQGDFKLALIKAER